MGVNFPDVRYVVMYGPARSLLDFHQEAGRGGRDGLSSDIVLYFYGQQLAHCEEDVRDFLKTSGCYRIASYKTFDPEIASFCLHLMTAVTFVQFPVFVVVQMVAPNQSSPLRENQLHQQ